MGKQKLVKRDENEGDEMLTFKDVQWLSALEEQGLSLFK